VGIRDKFPELLTQNIGIQSYQAYDAVYMIAYSVVAAGSTELIGTTIGSNVRRLNGGPPIQTGTLDLPRGISALQQPNGTISLNGISGPLVFDAKGARPPFNSRVFCVNATNGVATAVSRPGYMFDAANGKPVGALPASGPPCP